MKNEELYQEYINYLDWKLNEKKLNKGKHALLKISRVAFDEFRNRLQNDETFNDLIIEIMKSENRDKKIEDIFDDFD